MGFFSKRQSEISPPPVKSNPTQVLLDGYGKASLESLRSGQPITDPRFGWDIFLGPYRMILTEFPHGLDNLYGTAKFSQDATLGAYRVLSDLNLSFTNLTSSDTRFLEILDASLEYLRSLGFSSGHLTGYETDRWLETHDNNLRTFDGLVEVDVPSEEDASIVHEPEIGESKLIALTGPLPNGNEFFVEHRSDGVYVAYSVRNKDSDDLTRVRSVEMFLGAPAGEFSDYSKLLRAVGEMFQTSPYWFHEDLEPYFTLRRGP